MNLWYVCMILGIGTDILDNRRLEAALARQGERLARRLFTEAERQYAQQASNGRRRLLRYGNRFAAKEACIKALGAHGTGISWQEIEVGRESGAAPTLYFTGRAKDGADALLRQSSGVTPAKSRLIASLSLSDEWPYSQAFVVLSAGPTESAGT